jgi:4'-phosphopantetheinyl transferase
MDTLELGAIARRIPLEAPWSGSLWIAPLEDCPSAALVSGLDEQEHRRAQRFVFERDRRRYLAAHVALRAVLSAHLGIRADQLEFETGPFGKPGLRNSRLEFNLSHSVDTAVIAVTMDNRIGVDIEFLRNISDQATLTESVCSVAEQHQINADPARCLQAFLTCWTRKEACLKALGDGLSMAPSSIEVGATADATEIEVHHGGRLEKLALHSVQGLGSAIVAVARVQ